ncbi:MAG: hypothetical protein U5L03_02790 [Burkholderiaceae bacterium]|nr:hypothetical protein [Burkholderiaceae bacterium]
MKKAEGEQLSLRIGAAAGESRQDGEERQGVDGARAHRGGGAGGRVCCKAGSQVFSGSGKGAGRADNQAGSQKGRQDHDEDRDRQRCEGRGQDRRKEGNSVNFGEDDRSRALTRLAHHKRARCDGAPSRRV